MQIEAFYDHGQLKFNRPIQFAKEYFPVIIQIPDSEIIANVGPEAFEESSAAVTPAATHLLQEIRRILGPLSKRRPAVGVGEDKATLVEVLEEKYGIPKAELGKD
ncbi:MAG: hypothetical protein EA420_20020 [Candidatus Competibacteraceae bacterium]|nr:MAG: hypothetical protein EA420_20020 [Candidatus Competibacteraceae bacterium]